MLRALLFDFNGVIVGDEPLHFALFQKTLAAKNILLAEQEYYEKYLGYDDEDCLTQVLKDKGIPFDPSLVAELIRVKARFYLEEVQSQNLFIPGAIDFIRYVASDYYLGIVSGALKQEIETWLKKASLAPCFQTIVAAEDVMRGKPSPDGYQLALSLMNRDCVPNSQPILPQECLVIEDSKWGIQAAQDAGMKCLALATSYPKEALKIANWVAKDFSEIRWQELLKQFNSL